MGQTKNELKMSASLSEEIEGFSREVCRLVRAGEFAEAKGVIEHLLLITGSSEVEPGEREFYELLVAAGEEFRKSIN